ncbi:MAG: hypothetical protein OXT74_16985 [Candidatus Poribacteria bacterium]|nr:hypothetical protein [Candidatus Poribacteria bacterium]
MRNNRIYINLTGCVIATGICYYLITVALAGIVHDHEHEHDHGHSKAHDCSICFFIANYFGIALHTEGLPNHGFRTSIHSPFDPTFISTAIVGNVRSRAPPASVA